MALTPAQLLAALRLDADNAQDVAEATRILASANAMAQHYAPEAPEVIRDEAVIRLAGYLYDAPAAPQAGAGASRSPLMASGASALLAPYRAHRAGIPGEAATGTGGTGTGTGGPGVDQMARDEAAANLRRIAANEVAIEANRQAAAAASAAAAAAQREVDAVEATVAALPAGRELSVMPTGDPARLITLPVNYREFDIIFLNWPDSGGDVEVSLSIDLLPADANRAYRSGGNGRVEWNPTARTFTLSGARGGAAFRPAELYQAGVAVGTGGGPLRAGSVGTNELADNAVTAPKIADDAVTGRKVAAQAIATGHLADASVTGPKIPRDTIDGGHIAADAVGNSELAGNAVGTDELRDTSVTEAKLAAALAQKVNARITGLGKVRAVVNSITPATIESSIAGENDGDLAIGYTQATVAIFRYAAPPTNEWQELVRWSRIVPMAGRTDAELERFIEAIVSAWAIQGNADGIPGAKTFDGLFKSEAQTPIPGANVTVTFEVGNAADADLVDETDAAATNFAISEEQAAESAAFLRCRYNLERIRLTGQAPRDIELILQLSDGTEVGTHNIKDEGAGAAQFPIGDAGQYRWAVRVVTQGAYTGDVRVTETEYHSAQPLADKPMEHVAEAAVSVEAEKRQAEDKRLTDEVARVEAIKAIVNGLPSPTRTRKGAIQWREPPQAYYQTVADAFQVPATGFVQFILGNLGATPIMRAEDCINRQMTGIYTFGRDNVGLEFDAQRRAIVVAQRASERSPLANDIANTTTGLVMLHWAPARASGHATSELADLETRVEALEARPAGGAWELIREVTFDQNQAVAGSLNLSASDSAAIVAGFKRGGTFAITYGNLTYGGSLIRDFAPVTSGQLPFTAGPIFEEASGANVYWTRFQALNEVVSLTRYLRRGANVPILQKIGSASTPWTLKVRRLF